MLQGSGRDAEEYNLLFHAIKTKNRSCLELVLQKMLTIHGPDSFKWANSKGMIISIAKRCSYNSPTQRSQPNPNPIPIPLIALKQERPMM